MGKLFNRIFIIFTLLFILILSLGMVSAEDNITDLKEMQNDSSSCTDLTLDLDRVDQNQADSVVNENNNSDSNCDYIEEGSVNEQDSNQNINSKLLLGENRDSSMSDKNLNVSLRNYSGRTDSECLIYAKLIDSDGTKSKRINITIDGKTFNDSYTSPFLFGLTLPSNEGIYGCQIVVYDSITNETYGYKSIEIEVNNTKIPKLIVDVRNLTLVWGKYYNISFFVHDDFGNPIDNVYCYVSQGLQNEYMIKDGVLNLEMNFSPPMITHFQVYINNFRFASGNNNNFYYLNTSTNFYVDIVRVDDKYLTDTSDLDAYFSYIIDNSHMNVTYDLNSTKEILPGNVTVSLFNKTYRVLNMTNYTLSFLMPDEPDVYTGVLKYYGPYEIYFEKTFQVSTPYRKQTFMEIDPVFYMELGSKNYRINFTVKDEDDNLVKGEETIFGNYLNMELKTFYDGIQKIGVLESKSSWEINSPNYIGNYSCFIHYVSDKYTFLDSYAYFNIIVYNKVNMTMDYRNISYGEDTYFIFNLNADNGENVLGIVDLSLINNANNFNKTYVVNIYQDIQRINRDIIIQALDAGTYDVFAKYRGNAYFDAVNVSSKLVVNKLKTSITASDMKTYNTDIKVDGKIGKYFKLRLLDQNYNPLSNKKVKITINNKTYTLTTNSDGSASLQINIKKLGNYSCSISFPSEENYFGSSKTIKITIVKRPIPTKVKIKAKYSSTVGKKIKLKATVKDKFGNKMKKGKVGFYVDGKVYTAKVKNGVATVTISCPPATLVKKVKKTVGKKIKTTSYYSSTYYCTVDYRGYKYYAKNSTKFKIISKSKDVNYKRIKKSSSKKSSSKKSSRGASGVTYNKKVSKSREYDETKNVNTKAYKYKNVDIGDHEAGIEKTKIYGGQYHQYIRIYDYDMSITKLKFYYKKKGKHYKKTYKMPKKFFNFWLPKGYNCYKVKLYYYTPGHKSLTIS